jgi:hypothetical protein
MPVPITDNVAPRIGMVATVRNRRGVVSSVRPFDGPEGVLNLVDIEYSDGEQPLEESLVWERESFKQLLSPSALPDVESADPMRYDDLLAMVRSCRWSARTPFVDPDGSGPMARLPVTSPFHGAVQVEDYQLVPLLKALRMPRVTLLLADDVGLGKTIEAGLILSELLLRRRIRRILILTPAALRTQWKDEMWCKFSLPFEVVDRDATVQLHRQMGMDANPWRSHSRIITSYHYLKQPDVMANFIAACKTERSAANLPWDLIIVDEVHNLTPAPFGEESDLCQMLRQIAPLFEHRIFMTATPHNGHTRSFTGLLELLDPVRFSQTNEMKPAEKERVSEVRIRRLKRQINAASSPKKFCDRLPPQALMLKLSSDEVALVRAFSDFRKAIRTVIQKGEKKRRLAGNFAIEILGKRLLSCPITFAESWWRCRAGMEGGEDASDQQVVAASKALGEETSDDREASSLSHAASATIGAWLRPYATELKAEFKSIERALEALGLGPTGQSMTLIDPKADARFSELIDVISTRLLSGKEWLAGERLVLFTEYKTTLDYLLRRLRARWPKEQDRFLCLFGGMDDVQRDEVKRAFNDPNTPVRVLLATDAASEGLNLQETARYLLHYDIPWNPARLEQRNGRLDRHGQARDVQTWHFMSDQDQDLSFMDLVVRKVDTIREDLGATGDVFDESFRRLIEGDDVKVVRNELEIRIQAACKQIHEVDGKSDESVSIDADDPAGDLVAISAELDFDPAALRETLDAGMALRVGRPRVTTPDAGGRCALVAPFPKPWEPVIDDSIRTQASASTGLGALMKLAFDPAVFMFKVGERSVFRSRPDTALMHLAHPMIQKTLSSLARLRFPGGNDGTASCWTVDRADIPADLDAILQVTVEELAVNDLREMFHHWVRTIRIPVKKGRLGEPLDHTTPLTLRRSLHPVVSEDIEKARDLWVDVAADLKSALKQHSKGIAKNIGKQLPLDEKAARDSENQRYNSRQGEISTLIQNTTMERLRKEIEELGLQRQQGLLFDQDRQFDELDRNIETREEELRRRRSHYEEIRRQLTEERERIIDHLIPKRYTLRGEVQILPVAVEILFPKGAK